MRSVNQPAGAGLTGLPPNPMKTHPNPSRIYPRLLRSACLLAALWSSLPQGRADTASVVTAANTLITTSVASGASPTVQTSTYTLTIAKQWTNLPGGTRNGPTIGGGPAALSTDLSASVPSGQTISPRAAAIALCQTALSDVGYNTMNEIRNADDEIRSTDNTQTWNYGNYHVAVLGTPSTTTPWMLQISGHHLTYNITYNGPYVGATPMFIGTEPVKYYTIGTDLTSTEEAVVKATINGTTTYLVSFPYNATSSTTSTTTDPGISTATVRAPLETQRAAVSALSTSLQSDNTGAKLGTTTFSDVVLGVTNSGDGNFPFINTTPTYPTGTSGRGVLYTSLTATEKAEVKTMIEAWVKTQAADVSASLLADYESDAALAQTYVGYQVGAGSADGGTTRCNFDADVYTETTPINSQNSYCRVDGPRVWIEMVVQASVAYRNQNLVHYHSLWRDKLADYGNEFGGYLDTTSTSTTYTRPTITTQPANYSISEDGSATFSVVATGTGTLSYQWYKDAVAISGATASTYTVSDASSTDAGSYYVVITNAYGLVTSSSGALTVATSTGTTPTITTQPTSISVAVGGSASFTVAASGSGTLSYQWYKDSSAITGATSTTYTIASVATTDAGTYDCIVTNSVGSATSSAATLTVTTNTGDTTPTITTQPTSLAVDLGASATFTVAATGSSTLSYQWYKDNVAISGATSSTYTVAAAAASDAGSYYVTVTNSVGTVASATALLTINSVTLPVVNITVGGDGYLYEATPTTHKGKVVFTLSSSITSDLTVYYKIKGNGVNGNATNGTDYVGPDGAALSGTVIIPAGSTKYKLKVAAVAGSTAQGTEPIRIQLLASPTTAYTVGTDAKIKLYLVGDN